MTLCDIFKVLFKQTVVSLYAKVPNVGNAPLTNDLPVRRRTQQTNEREEISQVKTYNK